MATIRSEMARAQHWAGLDEHPHRVRLTKLNRGDWQVGPIRAGRHFKR